MTSSIKKQLFSGVFYTALAKYSNILISLVVTGVLSRMLPSSDFGVMAVATVVITFFSIFTDMGISTAIVQHKSLTKQDLSQIFSFTVWTGALLALLFFGASWSIGDFYNDARVATLCQLLSINLFFASATIVPNALFYRNKEFRFIALRSFSIQVAGGIISIIAVFYGMGLYALTINPILGSILLFVISTHRYPQQLRITFGIEAIRKIFSYSAYQFLFSCINYFSRNLDKLLIGKHMGMSLLGYYDRSYRLMMLPLQNITQVITPVMHPILSDYQNDHERLASSYERIVRLLAFIGFPLSALLCFTAKEAIFIVYGNQWILSVPTFEILALSVGVQVVISSSGSIFQASGDTRSLFICGLFSAVLNVSGILLGVFYFSTLTAVAWCITITFTINFVQCYWQMYRVTFKRSAWILGKQLLSPIIVSLLIAACLLPIHFVMKEMNIFVTAITKGIISFIIFGLYIQLTHEYDIVGKVRCITNKFRH